MLKVGSDHQEGLNSKDLQGTIKLRVGHDGLVVVLIVELRW